MEEKEFVAILSSCSDEIDDYYGSIARSIAHILAGRGYNLVFGGSSTGKMSWAIYDEFSKQGKEIYLFTTEKYADDRVNLPKAKSIPCETTFDMKKGMFENADLVVALAGGLGSLSELSSYIEENRSNDKNVPIEIYDEDEHYLPLIECIKILVDKKMISADIFESFKISHDRSEFEEHIDLYEIEKRKEVKIK